MLWFNAWLGQTFFPYTLALVVHLKKKNLENYQWLAKEQQRNKYFKIQITP